MSRESATDEGRAATQISVAIAAPSPRTEVGNSRLRVDACSAGATLSHFVGEGSPQTVDPCRPLPSRKRLAPASSRIRATPLLQHPSQSRRPHPGPKSATADFVSTPASQAPPSPAPRARGARIRLRSSSARKQRFTPAAWARSSDCVATVPFASVVPSVREVADVGRVAWPDRRAPERIVGRPVDSGQIRVHALT